MYVFRISRCFPLLLTGSWWLYDKPSHVCGSKFARGNPADTVVSWKGEAQMGNMERLFIMGMWTVVANRCLKTNSLCVLMDRLVYC